MAVNPLSLAESLRPWHAAGIRCFLAGSQGGREDASGCMPDSLDCRGEDECSPDEENAAIYNKTSQGNGPECAPAGALRSGAAPAPSFPRFAQEPGPVSVQQPSGRGARTQKGATTAPPAPAEGPFSLAGPNARIESWPEAWRGLYARSKPAPILWTYPELGQDLAGRGDKVRSACLRDFISRLQLPRGTSVFWPLGLADSDGGSSGEFPAEPGYFKAGLRLLQPKVVVFIGARAVEMADLGLGLGTPFTQKIFRGILFVLLPEFSAILERPSLVDKSCIFLRTSLGSAPSVFLTRQRP